MAVGIDKAKLDSIVKAILAGAPSVDKGLEARVAAFNRGWGAPNESEVQKLYAQQAKVEAYYKSKIDEYKHLSPDEWEYVVPRIKRVLGIRQVAQSKRTMKLIASVGYKGVDKEVRGLIRDLDKAGITTQGSCSGHGGEGYVTFAPHTYQKRKADIETMFRQHGVQITRWDAPKGWVNIPGKGSKQAGVSHYAARFKVPSAGTIRK